jgi:YidC/Oxa1 family membrane protein insertase
VLSIHPLLANALFTDIGKVFHPLFWLFAWILAGIYAVIPNYGLAIFGLTVLIMLVLTPVTVKSTKSMLAMQRLQPELKKLQTKYKGPENREMLNQEMMRLYKENGTSPFGACLPSFLQMPFLIVLYSLIRGLSYVPKVNGKYVLNAQAVRYVNHGTKMYHDLIASFKDNAIHMHTILGMDLAQTPLNHHGSNQAVLILPYLALIALSMFLQYFQMRQMNNRNPQAAAANPQMQTMTKVMPLLFGFIYLNVPAGAAIYMVVSSAMRIGTQEVMFRTGMVSPVVHEREIGGTGKAKTETKSGTKTEAKPAPEPAPAPKKSTRRTSVSDGTGLSKPGTAVPKRSGGSPNGAAGRRPGAANGRNGASQNNSSEEETAAKPHPRSRAKKTRKAR